MKRLFLCNESGWKKDLTDQLQYQSILSEKQLDLEIITVEKRNSQCLR